MYKIYALCVALLSLSSASAGPWPIGETSRPECRDALRIANRAYASKAFYLYEARGLPKDLSSRQVIKPIDSIDLSGGDATVADPQVFDRLNKDDPYAGNLHTYWQRQPHKGIRLVLDTSGHGWRGANYGLYAIPAGMDIHAFRREQPKLAPLTYDSWVVPLVFADSRNGSLWVIDTVWGPYLDDWRVFSPAPNGMTLTCTVRFVGQQKDALKLVPAEVRILANMLDQALGPGLNEGTLQPTGHIRYRSQQVWANVALRPWALSRAPYNTRREVDKALKGWSRKAHTFKALHARIYQQYPLAQRALAQAYITRFGKTPEEADAMAAKSLDFAFRSYFVFPREDNR